MTRLTLPAIIALGAIAFATTAHWIDEANSADVVHVVATCRGVPPLEGGRVRSDRT